MSNSNTEKDKKAQDNEIFHPNLVNIKKQKDDFTLVYQLEQHNLSQCSDGKTE